MEQSEVDNVVASLWNQSVAEVELVEVLQLLT